MTRPDDGRQNSENSRVNKGIEPKKRKPKVSSMGEKGDLNPFWAAVGLISIGVACLLFEKGLNIFVNDGSGELILLGAICIIAGLFGLIRPDWMRKSYASSPESKAKLERIQKWLIPLAIVIGVAFGFFQGRLSRPEPQGQEIAK